MDPNAWTTGPPVPHRDLEWSWVPTKPCEDCGGPMAQDRTRSRREYCGHPTSFHRKHPVTDGVDPAMGNMQSTQRDPVFDCTPANARVEQLTPRDDALLLLGEPDDELVHP